MERLDITITATLRPSILKRTLDSFFVNLFREWPVRIIINIDPVGDEGTPESVLALCHEYTDTLLALMPTEASFPRAFKLVWSSANSSLIFHLEEDWVLTRPIDLKRMVSLLKKYPTLYGLRLPFQPVTDSSKNWGTFFPWNGEFFECPKENVGTLGFCGHPSLWKREFVQFCADHLDPTRNPEKQIKWRHPLLGPFLRKGRFGVFSEQQSPRP